MGTLQGRQDFTSTFVATANIYEGNIKIPLYIDCENTTYYESIIQTSSKRQSQFLAKLYKKRSQIVHPYLIKINYVSHLNDLCIFGLKMYTEYLPITLKDQLDRRGKEKPFTEKEVIGLLRDITEAVLALETQSMLWSWLSLENIKRRGQIWKIHQCRYNQMETVGDLGINLKDILWKLCEDQENYSQKLRNLMRRVQYYTPEQIFAVLKDWWVNTVLPETICSTPVTTNSSIIIVRKHVP